MMQEFWLHYGQHAVIGGLFLWACRQLWRQFCPSTASGCNKGCGADCPATALQDRLAEAEAAWEMERKIGQ